MLEFLISLIPSISHFQNFEIKDSDGNVLGHQVTLVTKQGVPFSGGTASDLNLARRICAAESIERAILFKIEKSSKEIRKKFLVDEFPTSCGFAAGFDERHTIFRAICEAVERRAWSKWIDEGNGIPEVNAVLVRPLSKYYAKFFDRVHFFQTPLKVEFEGKPFIMPNEVLFSAVIGVKGNGIFPGSRVTTKSDEQWEHGLLEAWRHLMIFRNELTSSRAKNVYDARIKRFGEDGIEMLTQIRGFKMDTFGSAKLRLIELVEKGLFEPSQTFYVYRSLCDDFIGWDKGDENRFIY